MHKYGIIGFGALGKLIFTNLLKFEEIRDDIKLVAICNDDISTITKNVKINIGDVNIDNVDFSQYNLYTDYKEMLEKEELDFVFVTLPSFLHCEVCTYCLEHGVDVYVEKPMAISMEQCDMMMKAAKDNNRKLMVGLCLRFSNEYRYLKELVDSEKYGKVVKAEFFRKSPYPVWSANGWLLDEKKSGGCIVDMHIHDVDIAVWLFGAPQDITSYSTHCRSDYESVYALYKYQDKMVSVIGDWGIASAYKFNAGYNVTFEKAYVENKSGKVVLYTDEEITEVEFEDKQTSYYREVVEFIEAVVNNKPFVTADIDSVYETMKVVFKEKYM